MFLGYNLRHPALRKVAVRRAVSEAIDRQRIVDEALRRHGRVADDPIWPSHWAYDKSGRKSVYDVASARRRLDASGFPVAPSPTPHQMPNRFRFTCLISGEDPLFERVALMVQRDLSNVGVDMQLDTVPRQALLLRMGKGDFDAVLFQTNGGRSFDRVYQLWHSPKAQGAAQLNSGYNGADQALERLRAPISESETRLAVSELRSRFYEDAPAVFLAWPNAIRAIDSQFELGDAANPDIFTNAGAWRRELAPTVRASR
jgi:ABC-type transport system substrate-binding protein